MNPPDSNEIGLQVAWLFILAIPVSAIAWTVTREELFREPRDYCVDRSERAQRLFTRKFYYLFTCEFCFSHYIVLGTLALTRFHLLLDDWRGYVIAFFALVWVANLYMSIYSRLRVDIRAERAEVDLKEAKMQQLQENGNATETSQDGKPESKQTRASLPKR